jgi:hypothetical protein
MFDFFFFCDPLEHKILYIIQLRFGLQSLGSLSLV